MTGSVRVERQRTIRAPQQRVYQLLSRVEGLPRFADLWLAADVQERGGGQVVAEFRGYFGGLPVDSLQRVTLRPSSRVEFRQVRGTFKALRGEYVVEAEGQGARLTARLEVDAGIPLLSDDVVRTVISNALDRLLTKVRDAAERDLPRLVPRRAAAPGAAAAAPDEPAPALEVETEGPKEVAGEPAEVSAAPPAAAVAPSPAPVAHAPAERAPSGRASAEARRGRRRRRRHRRRHPGSPPASGGPAPPSS